MSRFINMSKYLGEYLSRALTCTGRALSAETSPIFSGFSRWRSCYERLSKRKDKQRCTLQRKIPRNVVVGLRSNETFPNTLKRRRSAMRCRFDQVDLNVASVLSGMRVARLLSINAHQNSKTMPALFRQSVRTKCGRENCADPCKWPICPPGNPTFHKPKNKYYNIYEAYWDDKHDNCCEDECKWANTRFDDIYFRETDKYERVYRRTWHECPPRVIPKKICCYEEGLPPEICKRDPKKERPPTACVQPCNDLKCPRFTLPCCCPVRKNTTCKPIVRGLQDCKKFCAPYPSFSECIRKRPKPRHPIECQCLRMPMTCEMNEYFRNRFPHWSTGCA